MLVLTAFQALRYDFYMEALNKRQCSARQAIFRGFLAFLIVLQTAVLAASPAFANKAPDSASANGSLIASTINGDCHAPGGEKSPAQGRHDHSQCCILCSASARDSGELLAAAILLGLATYSAPEPTLHFIHFSNVDFNVPPLGWTSSWSSRAPPRSN